MRGGGLGDFAPGEWSDDTSMLIAIALAGAEHRELRSAAALDAVATGFLDWYDANPPDIGIQTRGVLGDTRHALSASGSVVASGSECASGSVSAAMADASRQSPR